MEVIRHMITVTRRFLTGRPVRREEINATPLRSERIARVVENVRRRERR